MEDPSRDRIVPAIEVQRLFKQGILSFNAPLNRYAVMVDGICPLELSDYPMVNNGRFTVKSVKRGAKKQ